MRVRRTLLLMLMISALGCGHGQPAHLAGTATEGGSLPLTGTALVQHKHEMRRALESLFVFRHSLETLAVRREARNREVFSDFLEAYFGMHIDPLVRRDLQGGRPELTTLRANLTIAKADLLIGIGERPRAEAVLAELAQRVRGNERLLIEYPPGEQTTVGKALELLHQKRWWAL